MNDILTNSKSYSERRFDPNKSVTALALCVLLNPYPVLSPPLPSSTRSNIFNKYPWESGSYTNSNLPLVDYSDLQKVSILKNFAVSLVTNMQDIPPEFAMVLDEHFWELV